MWKLYWILLPFETCLLENKKRKHSSSDRTTTRMSSERVAMRLIVERQTPVKTFKKDINVEIMGNDKDKKVTTLCQS